MEGEALATAKKGALEGKLLVLERERAFEGEDVARFLKHALCQTPGKLLFVRDGAPPSIA